MVDGKKCQHCDKPGGRRVVDPYSLAVNNERVVMRLHAACATRRREDI